MYQPVVLFIALRYMFKRSADRFNQFISLLSIIGIAIGVMSLIIILSVMNGFDYDFEKNILQFMPQALIIKTKGSVDPHKLSLDELKLSDITRVSPITIADVILQSAQNVSVGRMLGININENDPLTPYLINTQQSLLKRGKYNIILGKEQALMLGVKAGDHVRVIVPSVLNFTPIGFIPNQRIFTVLGIYKTNTEVDGYQVLTNQQDASSMMNYPIGNITGWRLWLKTPLNIDILSNQKLPHGMLWKDWREYKGDLFQATRIEKKTMVLLLSLIVVVSGFNILTSIGLITMDKRAEIAILQTQGLKKFQIMTIFVIYGGSIGIAGALTGTFLGLLFASHLHHLMSLIPWFINGTLLPSNINAYQVISITMNSIFITFLATLYPSWHAASIEPAKALRYE